MGNRYKRKIFNEQERKDWLLKTISVHGSICIRDVELVNQYSIDTGMRTQLSPKGRLRCLRLQYDLRYMWEEGLLDRNPKWFGSVWVWNYTLAK